VFYIHIPIAVLSYYLTALPTKFFSILVYTIRVVFSEELSILELICLKRGVQVCNVPLHS